MALWNTPALWQSAESQLSLQKNLLEDSSCATSSRAAISARAWALSQQCSSQAGCFYHTSSAAKYKLQRDAKLERDIWHPRLCLATGPLLASVSSLVNPSSWAAAVTTLVNCRTWVYLLSFGTVLRAQLFCSWRLQQLKQGSQSVIRINSSVVSEESKRRMNLTKTFEGAWASGFTVSARNNDFQRNVPDHQPWGIKSWRVLMFIHEPSDFDIKLKGSVTTRCNTSVLFPADMGDEEKGLATTQTSQGPSPSWWKKQGSWA